MSPRGARAEPTPQRLAALASRERRRALVMTTVRSVVAFAVVLAVYVILPVGDWAGDGTSAIRLVLGVLAFVLVLVWQIRRVLHSRVPALQAVEALIIAIPTFIAAFASTYLSISTTSPGSFNEPLDKAAALYFTVVTLGTVGFGDIAPVSTGARLVVASQIMLDLVLIAAVIRLLAGAARRSLHRESGPSAG